MMMNGQCGWMFGCVVVALLHHKSNASNADHSPQKQPTKGQTPETDQETEQETETGVTCYTCVNVSDNLVCNQFAIDRPCPKGESFCHTLHIMDSQGESVVVNKKCADVAECSPGRVGCLHIDSQKVCVACCDEMYCNKSVPTNHSTAIFSNERTRLMKPTGHQPNKNHTLYNSAAKRYNTLGSLRLLLWGSLALAIFRFA